MYFDLKKTKYGFFKRNEYMIVNITTILLITNSILIYNLRYDHQQKITEHLKHELARERKDKNGLREQLVHIIIRWVYRGTLTNRQYPGKIKFVFLLIFKISTNP